MKHRNDEPQLKKEPRFADFLRDSAMLILFLIFILLYAAAFTGKLDPLKDNTLLLRLEPVIFIIVGYYFGRFPSRRSEQTLKEEITRQTQRADAAQFAKETLQQEREVFEEKIKNVRSVLKTTNRSDKPNESTTLKTVSDILDS